MSWIRRQPLPARHTPFDIELHERNLRQCGHIWKCGQTPPKKERQWLCVQTKTGSPVTGLRLTLVGACSFLRPPPQEHSGLRTH